MTSAAWIIVGIGLALGVVIVVLALIEPDWDKYPDGLWPSPSQEDKT